jgi:SAM-dependent methyltransferase
MSLTIDDPPGADAYAVLAPVYDLLTRDYAHDRWIRALLALASSVGMRGTTVLDVACGTGKSFLPLLARGYRVVACDISPAMLREAAVAAGDRAVLHRADMRRLPRLGSFPLVTCLDDAINHLDSERELIAALGGMRRNLAPSGVLVFDVNLLSAYSAVRPAVRADGGRLVRWNSVGDLITRPGARADVVIDVFTRATGDRWRRAQAVQAHRHFPLDVVQATAARAGLEVLAVHGQRPGATLDAHVDEGVHHKAVIFASPARSTKGGTMLWGP